jgi:hypothetical protein
MVRRLLAAAVLSVAGFAAAAVRAEGPKTDPRTAGAKPAAAPKPAESAGAPAPLGPVWRNAAPVIRERVSTPTPRARLAEADEDALAQAVLVIEEKLAGLDPPVHYQPSIREVEREYLRRESREVQFTDDGLVVISYEVEVTAEQVRNLRTEDRVVDAMRAVVGLTALSGIAFLFFRADERTKGYLTRWLAIGAVGLAAAAAAALYLK